MQHYNSTPVSHPPEAIRCRRSKSPPTHGHCFRSAPPGLFPLSEPIPKENILPHTVPECPSHGAPPLRSTHTASHFLPLTHPGTRVPDPRLPESLPDFRCTLRGSPAPFGSGQARCRCRPFPLQSRSKQYDCGDSFHTADCNQRQISAEHSQKIRYFFYHHFAFLLAGTMEPAIAEVLFPNRKNPCNF